MNVQRYNSQLIVTSGDNLILCDETSGGSHAVNIPPPDLPPNLTKGQMEILNKQDRTINSIAISNNGQYIAVSTENKQVVIYDNNLKMKRNFIVNRTASQLAFSSCGDILVADRTGDVFLYKLSEENSEPTLLLGHLSMILDVALSECGKYVVTCDRDEKIRISRFPNTYNIVSYCLGHEEFVTRIKIVKNILVSASGDGTVRIWNFLKGEQLNMINTNHYIANRNLLDAFSKEMEKEKVDVVALPVSDMQAYYNSNNLFVGISIHSYNKIQLYKINLENYESTYLTSIESIEIPYKFCLTDILYIFDSFKISVYKLTNGNYTETPSPELENFYKKHKHIFKFANSNCITVLYKRKFDNVQEYLDRKKMRLESYQ
ncbi:WD40 domain containing protein [Asbolus verrucosus]|uniref:WD40 domain containing protein n=1 Tax=Asbolus verrucosus TaxID=1661398 RepID=A0A482WE41_ASBVE|nr:WD40 domain containing protein [Asbolus verrucosus]